jgi:hypothetical protein
MPGSLRAQQRVSATIAIAEKLILALTKDRKSKKAP